MKSPTDVQKLTGQAVKKRLLDNAAENARRQGDAEYTRKISSIGELSYATGLSRGTVYKLHSGEFSARTLRVVEGVIGDIQTSVATELPSHLHQRKIVASGGYSKELIAPYLGTFITTRRGTTVPENLLTTRVQIFWDEEDELARFHELNRFTSSVGREMDYSQSGTVHRSQHMGVIHLMTAFQGAVRLVSLGRMQIVEPVMFGMMLTQVQMGGTFVPTSSVVHFRKLVGDGEPAPDMETGVIRPEDPKFAELERDLLEAQEAVLLR